MKKNIEIARIVESPVNDIETDLAQIALGYPSKPNYRGVQYMIDLLKNNSIKKLEDNKKEYLNEVYHLVQNSNELNTLGYVFLKSNLIKEALLTFYYNTLLFRFEPNVYDSYGEALAETGQKDKAIECYEKVLLLDRSNTNAKEQLKKLKEK